MRKPAIKAQGRAFQAEEQPVQRSLVGNEPGASVEGRGPFSWRLEERGREVLAETGVVGVARSYLLVLWTQKENLDHTMSSGKLWSF